MFKIFADWIVYTVIGLQHDNQLAKILHFFFYDSSKIIVLLGIIIYVMTLINSYIPIEKIKNFLSKNQRYGLDHVFAAILGAITPFCSCSSVPLFIGFLKGGIPLGITLSFLITSPLINEIAIAMLLGIFGVKITILYVSSGILLGTVGGWILGKMGLEAYLDDFLKKEKKGIDSKKEHTKSSDLKEKLYKAYKETVRIATKVIPYVIGSIFLGALIHNFVPTHFFEIRIKKYNIFSVPLAVVLGIPLYANAASIIPIVQVLIVKGIPLGTGLAFMMATVGLSLPEFLLLKRVMRTKLLIAIFGTIGICIILLGYLFNRIL